MEADGLVGGGAAPGMGEADMVAAAAGVHGSDAGGGEQAGECLEEQVREWFSLLPLVLELLAAVEASDGGSAALGGAAGDDLLLGGGQPMSGGLGDVGLEGADGARDLSPVGAAVQRYTQAVANARQVLQHRLPSSHLSQEQHRSALARRTALLEAHTAVVDKHANMIKELLNE
eukprot:TRINITY_DN4086_c0_g1_i2.p2 TRINITY_DN4086_c0_g1~~TRINITY_DN4086_c0_g1_i2.p2  ORF type:complete len:174 (+),score=62.48 TRINITY_DN4086_c0_g1_i2:308-829(+)